MAPDLGVTPPDDLTIVPDPPPGDEAAEGATHRIGEHAPLAFRLVVSPVAGRLRLLPAVRFEGGVEWVSAGQPLAVVESGPTNHQVLAPAEARLAGVLVRDGEPVARGQPLVWLEEAPGPATPGAGEGKDEG